MFGNLGKALKSKFSRDKDFVPTVKEYKSNSAISMLLDNQNTNVSLTSGVVKDLFMCDKGFTKTESIYFSGAENTEENIKGRDIAFAVTVQDDTSETRYFHRYPIGDSKKIIVSREVSFSELLSLYKEDDFADLSSGEDVGFIKAKKSAVKNGILNGWFSKKYRTRLYMPLTRQLNGSPMNVDYYMISNDSETKIIELFIYEDSRTDIFSGLVYEVNDFIENVSVES